MKKKILVNYWNKFYEDKKKYKESSFARFIFNKIKNRKKLKIIDIGCGNGRDAVFFAKKKHDVIGVDISTKAIKTNKTVKINKLKFLKFDIEKNKMKSQFDVVYCRFFLHTISSRGEGKLLKLIKSITKKNSLVCLEFRNWQDKIFYIKKRIHNVIVEYEKGHYRRIINPKQFIKTFLREIKSKIIFYKSSRNLSIVKKDNPHLSRLIFKVK